MCMLLYFCEALHISVYVAFFCQRKLKESFKCNAVTYFRKCSCLWQAFPAEAYLYNLEFVQKSAVGMKHLHLKKNIVPTLLLPKTRANTTLRLLVSAKTQTDAPVVEAVPGEAEPDFEPSRTPRVAAAVAATPLPQPPAQVASCARGTKISGFRKVPGEASCTLSCLLRELHIPPEVHTQVYRHWHAAGGREPVFCGPLDNLGEPAKCGWQPHRKPPSGIGIFFAGCLVAPVLCLLASIKMEIFTERTFYNDQRANLVPAVNEVFQEHESRLIDDLAGTEVELAASRKTGLSNALDAPEDHLLWGDDKESEANEATTSNVGTDSD
ncbi:hypothetical protein HPB48_020387 [Haemaphysalis longicornis]|uniref:Uncharacterized protein n=1 Tax=Haemaphysalis longicornis TaxID=44386 RepID=A0A9J6FTY1_HAELO|nr:hypothetical protein HPB48_020387 [Haemaphysalis longicornis]